MLLLAVATAAPAAPTPTPSYSLLAGTLSAQSFGTSGDSVTPTPEPTEPPCGDFSVQVKDPARCATIGKPAPCYARCGRLCWRKGRKTWELLGCERLGALLLPTPTPVPTATPRPTASPRPSPPPTRTPAPGPTMNACDRGEPGWCYYWKTGKCTHPCPEF